MVHDQHLSSACRTSRIFGSLHTSSRDRWCRLGCLSCTRQIWKSSILICVFCGRFCCCGPNGIRRLTHLLQLLLIKTNPKESPELPIMKVRRITCIDVRSTLCLKWCRRMALLAETKAIDRHDARSVRSRTRKNVNKCLPWSGSDRFPNHDTRSSVDSQSYQTQIHKGVPGSLTYHRMRVVTRSATNLNWKRDR